MVSALRPRTTNSRKRKASDGENNDAKANSSLVVPFLIAGHETWGSSTFDVTSPSSGEAIWSASSASKQDCGRAVESAREAFPAWRTSKPVFRRDILLKIAETLASRAAKYGQYMQDETGSNEGFSTHFNIPLSVEILRDVAGRIVTVCGSVPTIAEECKSAVVFKEPYGVVLGIAPW